MRLKIKYIPGIFPNVNFQSERDIENYKLMPLKPEITNFMTAERWAFVNDSIFINRIKQTIRDKRFELRFTIFESDDLSFIEQTTESQLITEEFDYVIHNVSISYELAGHRKYNIIMQFSIKDYNSIASPVESSYVNDYFSEKTEINFDFTKRFASQDAVVRDDPTDANLNLFVFIDNHNIKPLIGEKYYVHTSKLGADVAVEHVEGTFEFDGKKYYKFMPIEPFDVSFPAFVLGIRDLVLSSTPNIANYNLTENVENYSIYTAFLPKKLPRMENLGQIQTTAGYNLATDKLTSYMLDLPFFLSSDNLDLALALKNAKNIKVNDIYANESFEVFELTQEMINLFEFRLRMNYNIDRI